MTTPNHEVFLLWMKSARNHVRIWEEYRTINNLQGTRHKILGALEIASREVGHGPGMPPSSEAVWAVFVDEEWNPSKRAAHILPASDSAVLLLELEEELLAFEEFERTYVPVSP